MYVCLYVKGESCIRRQAIEYGVKPTEIVELSIKVRARHTHTHIPVHICMCKRGYVHGLVESATEGYVRHHSSAPQARTSSGKKARTCSQQHTHVCMLQCSSYHCR